MMEENVVPLHDSALHAAHAAPFSALKGAVETTSGPHIRIRYDGFQSDEGPRIFAVIPLSDLSLVAERMDMSDVSGPGLPGSPVFFLRTPDGPSVYIDTDRNEKLYMSILDSAMDLSIPVVEARGDLMRLCHVPRAFGNDKGDVSPPARAAFEANDFPHVPIDVGIERIFERPSGVRPDDPVIPEP